MSEVGTGRLYFSDIRIIVVAGNKCLYYLITGAIVAVLLQDVIGYLSQFLICTLAQNTVDIGNAVMHTECLKYLANRGVIVIEGRKYLFDSLYGNSDPKCVKINSSLLL